MSSTPALVLVGLVLVLLSIPLAFSLGPIVLGGFLLVLGYRRATARSSARRHARLTDPGVVASRRPTRPSPPGGRRHGLRRRARAGAARPRARPSRRRPRNWP